jgi:hypothetical protein
MSARDQYYSGKISAEEYARRVMSSTVGEHALRESFGKIQKIYERLERKKILI